jgi:hypothetical protein
MATRLQKSRARSPTRFGRAVEKLATRVQKLLTSNIIPPTMQTSAGTVYLLIRSEQAEEGARSFLLLMARVI